MQCAILDLPLDGAAWGGRILPGGGRRRARCKMQKFGDEGILSLASFFLFLLTNQY